nr:MAG TPA: hypothetical protein [Caudoviricetes sp.]
MPPPMHHHRRGLRNLLKRPTGPRGYYTRLRVK